jgi:hypothetical protein
VSFSFRFVSFPRFFSLSRKKRMEENNSFVSSLSTRLFPFLVASLQAEKNNGKK